MLLQIYFRFYRVSKGVKSSWQDAMTYCDNFGLGLAMWHTADTYDDLKTMTGSKWGGWFDKPAWTALNNANGENCYSAQDCDGKLVNDNIFTGWVWWSRSWLGLLRITMFLMLPGQ